MFLFDSNAVTTVEYAVVIATVFAALVTAISVFTEVMNSIGDHLQNGV